MSAEKEIRTICGFCHTNCGLIVSVRDGEITRIKPDPEHPVNMGEACAKGLAGRQIAYSPHRLRHPLLKTANGFKQVSWDTALDIIAEKLLKIRDNHGGETIVRGGGAPITEENRDGFSHLLNCLGSVNYTGAGHICHQPRDIGFQSVCGHMPQPDYINTRLMVFWGANPFASHRYGEVGIGFAAAYGRFSEIIKSARNRGVKLIVIDPWRSRLAEMADRWLQIEPGRDDALALAMLNVIITGGLYDREYVEKYTNGFEQLAGHVKKYPPAWAAKITGIKAEDIEEAAVLYATTRPAVIREGNGLDQHPNSVDTARAIAMLAAVTGNLDRKGGSVFLPFPKLTRTLPGSSMERLSARSYPLFPGVPFPAFIDAIVTGKPFMPRALIVNHANPLLIQANSNKVRQSLAKLELLVVCDIFKTATAEAADIILPETSPFERYGFRGYASFKGGFLAVRNKVIEPVGEARSVFDIEYALAERMGMAGSFPWKNTEEWITYRLAASGVTFEDLAKKHIIFTTPPAEYGSYLREGFKTPSGRMELYSSGLQEMGYHAMPEFKEIDGGTVGPADIAGKYPLIGTTWRSGNYTHTQFRNIPELRKLDPEELVRINPVDASALNISSGETVTVESPAGKLTARAKITDEIAAGVILIDFGWGNPGDGGENVNLLTSDGDRDPAACSTSNHRFRCRVYRE